MTPDRARRVLGVGPGTPWPDVRRAYLAAIRAHHPDRTGSGGARATQIIEAYRVLDRARAATATTTTTTTATATATATTTADPRPPVAAPRVEGPPLLRLADDSLLLGLPADEAFRTLLEAAHDVGEVTYLDRSGPILEVLCRFEGEPATSLVITVQGRATGTEVFCTATSIEARPGPPTAAVVDLLDGVLRARLEAGHRH